MADAPKSRMIILTVMAVIFFLTTSALYVFLNKTQAKNDDLEMQLNQTTIEKENVERDLEETIKVKVNLETQLKDAETRLAGIAEDLAIEKQAKEDAQGRYRRLQSDLKSTRNKLDSEKRSKLVLTTEKGKLNNELNDLKKDYDNVMRQIAQLRRVKDALEDKVANMITEQKAQLDKIVVTPKEVQGEVLVVNKEFGFVVVNLGQKDGVKVGTPFEVYRGNQHIGRVQVDKVYPSMSGATILPETREKLKEGDVAVGTI